jgi:hypothetical protein
MIDQGDTGNNAWEQRLAALWATLDDSDDPNFVIKMEALAAERPPGDAIALFERAAANDSTARPHYAVPLYRQALAAGLPGDRRRRAVIQLASSLRYLDQAAEAVALLTAERDRTSDSLDDAVTAFLALALVDVGREREAASMTLTALARHLPRYNRSLANYAKAIKPKADAPQK